MKATTKKTTIVSVLTLGLVSVLILSSFVAFKGRRLKGIMQNDEFIEYAKKNIVPVLKEKRENFDQNLSNGEKQKVAELQDRLSVLQSERRDDFQPRYGRGNQTPGERPEISDEQREKMKSHMKERRLIMTEAWAIADNHEAEIEAVMEELKPETEKWRGDIKELMDPYREERRQQREEVNKNRNQDGDEFRKGSRPGGNNRPDFAGRRPGPRPGGRQGFMNQYSTPPMFVLFDAENALNQLKTDK